MFAKIYKGFVFVIFLKWGALHILANCGCLFLCGSSKDYVVQILKSTLFIEE